MDENVEVPKFQGQVRYLKETDIQELRPILEAWIKDPETNEILENEVKETLENMKGSLDINNDRQYIVAEESHNIIGIVGIKDPDEAMMKFAATEKPAELVNFFVDPEKRGSGAGHNLLGALGQLAKDKGHSEIILNSGPRYKSTAWEFYNKYFGQPANIAKNFYGEGLDAPVWRKAL